MGRNAGRIPDDDPIAFFEARYRETGDPYYARRAYAWARDATDPPSRNIPEWVLECLDREVEALFALDEHVRADLAAARMGEKKNSRNRRPKKEAYFTRLASAVGWGPWDRLKTQAREFIAQQVIGRMAQSRPVPGGSRHDRRAAGVSKKKAITQTADRFGISDSTVRTVVRQHGKNRR